MAPFVLILVEDGSLTSTLGTNPISSPLLQSQRKTTATRTEVNETKKEIGEENNKESISIDTIWEQHEQNRKTNQIKSLQNHFYQRSTMARPVVRKRLVSYGSLIAVPINECEYDIGTDDARTDGRPRQRKSNEEIEQSFRFYEVVSLCSDTHIDGMDKNDNQNDEMEEKNDDMMMMMMMMP